MNRPAMIPSGAWPIRMGAAFAAGFVGESTVEAFLRRVGSEYPLPVVDEGIGKGRRRLWLKEHLEKAVQTSEAVAEDEVL